MTNNEVISKVTVERQTPGRFPSRLIFVHNFIDYTLLVDELKTVCDVTIDLANFAKGDVVPRFKDLKKELENNNGTQILLLSIGEYLRLCVKREINKESSVFPGIWEAIQSEHSTTKYIIPMFGGRELFDRIVPLIDERQKSFIWEINESRFDTEFTITVYAPSFAGAVQTDAANLQEWLEKWTMLFGDASRRHFSLTTKLCRYAERMFGNVRVEIVDEPFAYVASLVADGEKIKKEYGDELFWADVSKSVKRGEPFVATINNILNIGNSFEPVAILARFEQLTDTERRILWLLYKLYPADDYCTYAISKTAMPDDIPPALRDAIFALPKISESFIVERSNALRVLSLSYNDGYFAALDKLPTPEVRLSLLNCKTLEERAYAIKTVSELLRVGADVSAVVAMLRSSYPDLAEYLTESGNSDISRYFNWYRKNKLINRPTTDIPCTIDFDDIDSRNKVIQQGGNGVLFWIDGLGAEWLPLLLSKLIKLNVPVSIASSVTKSILPSETEYNHKWEDDDDKWDRLDKLSHDGMPDDKDYFSCVARQIEIVGEVADHISTLLEQNNRVIVTGDHGSSRLAALMFHVVDNFAVAPPKNAIVRSFGRFCELKDDTYVPLTPSMERVELDGKTYIVMKTYEHFKQSGNAAGGNNDDNAVAGEIHGGMTPEEYLVPVIVISRKTPLTEPKQAEIKNPKVANLNDMGI